MRYPVQAFDAVLRDVVLGDAEDVADLDAAAYLGAGPVMCLLEHPEEAFEDSWSEEVLRGSFAKHKTGPESRFARRRSKTIGLRLAADCSKGVVLRWRSTYCQTPSRV